MVGARPEHREGGEPPGSEEVKLTGNDWVFPSTTGVLEAVRRELAVRLAAAGWTEDELGNVPMAIDEAITNAIVHGNLQVPGKRQHGAEQLYHQRLAAAQVSERGKLKVHVQLDLTSEHIVVRVTDQGQGFVPPGPTAAVEAAAAASEGGYGITIMRGAFDTVEFEGSTVTMRKQRVPSA